MILIGDEGTATGMDFLSMPPCSLEEALADVEKERTNLKEHKPDARERLLKHWKECWWYGARYEALLALASHDYSWEPGNEIDNYADIYSHNIGVKLWLRGDDKPENLPYIKETFKDLAYLNRYWIGIEHILFYSTLRMYYDRHESKEIRRMAGEALGYGRARMVAHDVVRTSPTYHLACRGAEELLDLMMPLETKGWRRYAGAAITTAAVGSPFVAATLHPEMDATGIALIAGTGLVAMAATPLLLGHVLFAGVSAYELVSGRKLP
jgi:hypothetical protein